jgi:hypothetical protein
MRLDWTSADPERAKIQSYSFGDTFGFSEDHGTVLKSCVSILRPSERHHVTMPFYGPPAAKLNEKSAMRNSNHLRKSHQYRFGKAFQIQVYYMSVVLARTPPMVRAAAESKASSYGCRIFQTIPYTSTLDLVFSRSLNFLETTRLNFLRHGVSILKPSSPGPWSNPEQVSTVDFHATPKAGKNFWQRSHF